MPGLLADVSAGWSVVLAVVTAALGFGSAWWLQRQSQRHAERARRTEQERAERETRRQEALDARTAARALDGELRRMEAILEMLLSAADSAPSAGELVAEATRNLGRDPELVVQERQNWYRGYVDLHRAMVRFDGVATDFHEWLARRDILMRYLGPEDWQQVSAPYTALRGWVGPQGEPASEGENWRAAATALSWDVPWARMILDAVNAAREVCSRIAESPDDPL